LVSELRLTAGCVLMDLASPAVSGTSVYANGLTLKSEFYEIRQKSVTFGKVSPVPAVLSLMAHIKYCPIFTSFFFVRFGLNSVQGVCTEIRVS